jgi:hypothetical protein
LLCCIPALVGLAVTEIETWAAIVCYRVQAALQIG